MSFITRIRKQRLEAWMKLILTKTANQLVYIRVKCLATDNYYEKMEYIINFTTPGVRQRNVDSRFKSNRWILGSLVNA